MNVLIYAMFILIAIIPIYILENNRNSIQRYNNTEKFTLPIKKKNSIKIILYSLPISIYSVYLANTGYLSDTVRYSWSFLYRYPPYYSSFISMLESKTEIGFLIINFVVYKFTTDPNWMFFSVALIVNFMSIKAASKLMPNLIVFIVIYMISLYYFQTTYLLKQALAISTGNFALIAYLEKKYKKYIILSLIATSFHASAIILFPLMVIYKLTNTKKKQILLIFIIFFVFIFSGPIFNILIPRISFINKYINLDGFVIARGSGSLMSVFKGIPFYFISIIALIKRNYLIKTIKNADFFISSTIIYSAGWLLTNNMYWFFRIGWYCLLPTIAVIPILMKSFKKSKRILIWSIFLWLSILVTFRQIFITLI